MYYDQKLINEITRKNKIQDVVAEYVTLEKKFRNILVGKCPFHNEKAPSFCVDIYNQTFTCLGCGRYGNVITFIILIKNCSFEDAVSLLASRAGVFLPDANHAVVDKVKKCRMISINNAAARFYHNNLLKKENNAGMKYFHSRGLTDNTITKFGLGYAASFGSDLVNHLLSLGFTNDEIEEAGLSFVTRKKETCDKFWDRVIYPIINENNKVIGFGGRVLDDKKPKYLNSAENIIFDKGNNLYGLNIARYHKNNGFILCEGYMDVIALHQAGFNNAIASLGTALTSKQAEKIAIYTKTVYLSYDGDIPGINATLKAIKILTDCGIAVKVVNMGAAKDPDEFINRFGREAYAKELKNAEGSQRFILKHLSEEEKYAHAAEILCSYL